MTTSLRAGLVGLGRMGRNHARVLRHLDGVTLAGAADPAGDPYQAADGIPVHDSLDDLIAAGIDYAVLACPTSLHEPWEPGSPPPGYPRSSRSPWPPTPPRPAASPPRSARRGSPPRSGTSSGSTPP